MRLQTLDLRLQELGRHRQLADLGLQPVDLGIPCIRWAALQRRLARGQELIADFKAREAALRVRVSDEATDLSYAFWFSSPSPEADAYLGGKNGSSGFIADLLGGHNVIQTEV